MRSTLPGVPASFGKELSKVNQKVREGEKIRESLLTS